MVKDGEDLHGLQTTNLKSLAVSFSNVSEPLKSVYDLVFLICSITARPKTGDWE